MKLQLAKFMPPDAGPRSIRASRTSGARRRRRPRCRPAARRADRARSRTRSSASRPCRQSASPWTAKKARSRVGEAVAPQRREDQPRGRRELELLPDEQERDRLEPAPLAPAWRAPGRWRGRPSPAVSSSPPHALTKRRASAGWRRSGRTHEALVGAEGNALFLEQILDQDQPRRAVGRLVGELGQRRAEQAGGEVGRAGVATQHRRRAAPARGEPVEARVLAAPGLDRGEQRRLERTRGSAALQ